MNLVDTHTHLYASEFDTDREAVISRAKALGINRFYLPAIDSSCILKMKKLKAQWPQAIHLMAGLHPTYVKENWKDELQVVLSELDAGGYVAVGEIGIDLYWDTHWLKEQIEAFRIQINWAKARDLPIVIHCRSAFDEIFEVLEEFKSDGVKGIFHCFTGTQAQAELAISLGLKLGIGGVVTFKNGNLHNFLRSIDLKHLVLETDAPYLAPVPYRGKRNEPAYLMEVASKLSEIYHIPLAEIGSVTTANAEQIFGV